MKTSKKHTFDALSSGHLNTETNKINSDSLNYTLIDHLENEPRLNNLLYGKTKPESLAWQILKFEANRLLWINLMPVKYYANDIQIRNWIDTYGSKCDTIKETIEYIVEFRRNLQLEVNNG